MGTRLTKDPAATWPHISCALYVDSAGNIDYDFIHWSWSVSDTLSSAELATAYEEWADFFEYSLAQRADELAGNRSLRYLVEKWTESMAYCCRRSAAWAHGDDPGEWIPQYERRPDLCGFVGAVLGADADEDHDADRELVGAEVAR